MIYDETPAAADAAHRDIPLARLFISQDRIDRLSSDDRVVIEGDRLDLPALKASFRVRPAVYFCRVVTDDGDPHHLLGRVKTDEQLRELGAELVASSVLLGDTAYECENGFVGEVLTSGAGWMGRLKQIPE